MAYPSVAGWGSMGKTSARSLTSLAVPCACEAGAFPKGAVGEKSSTRSALSCGCLWLAFSRKASTCPVLIGPVTPQAF
jgi:hypothetical protein